MASCYICGTYMKEVVLDKRDQKIKPCGMCEEVVKDTVESFSRNDYSEDEWNFLYFNPEVSKEELETYRPSKKEID